MKGWQTARAMARKWCAENPQKLRGRWLLFPTFESDADCRWFYLDRDLGLHVMILKALGKDLRKKGMRLLPLVVSPSDCPAGAVASQQERTAYIESCCECEIEQG